MSELLAEERPVPVVKVGIRDRFCPTARNLDKLMDACGLAVTDVVAAARRAMQLKQ